MITVDCEHRVWPITRNTLIWKMQWYVHRSPCILNLQLFNLQTRKSNHHFTYYSPFGLQDLSTQLLATAQLCLCSRYSSRASFSHLFFCCSCIISIVASTKNFTYCLYVAHSCFKITLSINTMGSIYARYIQ